MNQTREGMRRWGLAGRRCGRVIYAWGAPRRAAPRGCPRVPGPECLRGREDPPGPGWRIQDFLSDASGKGSVALNTPLLGPFGVLAKASGRLA